jgi:hypothetical protein
MQWRQTARPPAASRPALQASMPGSCCRCRCRWPGALRRHAHVRCQLAPLPPPPPTLLYPAASQMAIASKVARATPPRVPLAGLGRT